MTMLGIVSFNNFNIFVNNLNNINKYLLIIGLTIYFVNALRSERCSYDDGLLQRILMCAPNPPRVRAKEMREKKVVIKSH